LRSRLGASRARVLRVAEHAAVLHDFEVQLRDRRDVDVVRDPGRERDVEVVDHPDDLPVHPTTRTTGQVLGYATLGRNITARNSELNHNPCPKDRAVPEV
jgi:hypothetical protein